MSNFSSLLDKTKQAVEKTGKSFAEIPKASILEYLDKQGIKSKDTKLEVYDLLLEYYNSKKKSKKVQVVEKSTNSSEHRDVTDQSITQKARKKNIFSDIKRIA